MKTSHTPESWPSLRISLSCLLAFGLEAHAAELANVRAQQRPKTKLVDVFYDLVADEGEIYDVSVSFSAPGKNPKTETLEGDVGDGILPGRNKHIVWDAGTDWPDNSSDDFTAEVAAEKSEFSPFEMVLIPGGTISASGDGSDLLHNMDPPPPPVSGYSFTGNRHFNYFNSAWDIQIPNNQYAESVSSFHIDKIEVTYSQWKHVYMWAIKHGYEFEFSGTGKGEKHPVQTISVFDIFKWCNARSEMETKVPSYTVDGKVYRYGKAEPQVDLLGNGYRLPTRHEFHFASRGGRVGTLFEFGDRLFFSMANIGGGGGPTMGFQFKSGGSGYLDVYVSLGPEKHTYCPQANDGIAPFTTPVGSFGPNGYGLHDMTGNVAEWTYAGPGSGYICGGSWDSTASECLLYESIYDEAATSSIAIVDNKTGFRCVSSRIN